MIFYLGVDRCRFLWTVENIPMFMSHRVLRRQKSWRRAASRWCLDSGGFSELSQFGEWTISPEDYVEAIYKYQDQIGSMDWCAIQDWMCEPTIRKFTGKSVEEHQRLTVDNFLLLTEMAPDLPFIPILQGWELQDYVSMVDMYADSGVDLFQFETVGLGSVCRRQSTKSVLEIVKELQPLKLHGFGVKGDGLSLYGDFLTSADSMAWSYSGRFVQPCPETGLASCQHCLHYALEWREKFVNEGS